MIKQDVIDRIRMETDIVELVGGYLPLKKVGRNYRALCPFHQERSPSFYVSPERQTYHCFGCGSGGNAISFLMEHDKLEFPEAVRMLAKRLGIEIVDESGGRSRGIYEACEQATQYFERQLQTVKTAQDYLLQRGLRNRTVKRFRLGFAPPGNRLRGFAGQRGWSIDDMVSAGLLVERAGGLTDYFHDRIVFPIMSLSGRVIGFGGRVLDDREPKYLNSADTPIFRKGDILYGLFQAKGYVREEIPLLVEGNFDLLSLADTGVNNVVAPLGTALTTGQARLIRRYNSRVTICFDGDDAGRKAARSALEVLLRTGCDPMVAELPSATDPDSLLRQSGRDAFLELATKPIDLVDFVLGERKLDNVPERRAAIREVVGLLKLVSDPTTRELYAGRLASRFDIDKATIMRSAERGVDRATPGFRTSPGFEERVLAAAVQDVELARVAKELGIREIIADKDLKVVAGLVDKLCEQRGFGPALLLERIEDEETRRRVAGWTFLEDRQDREQYRARVRRLRASWLHQQIVAAHAAGNESRAQDLAEERSRLLSEATQGKERP